MPEVECTLRLLNVTRVLVQDDRLENDRLRLRGTAQGGLSLGEQRFHVR
jgi:hypothetical protein